MTNIPPRPRTREWSEYDPDRVEIIQDPTRSRGWAIKLGIKNHPAQADICGTPRTLKEAEEYARIAKTCIQETNKKP